MFKNFWFLLESCFTQRDRQKHSDWLTWPHIDLINFRKVLETCQDRQTQDHTKLVLQLKYPGLYFSLLYVLVDGWTADMITYTATIAANHIVPRVCQSCKKCLETRGCSIGANGTVFHRRNWTEFHWNNVAFHFT